MMTAKLFKNGESQAVRLPKECRFSGTEVTVAKIGEVVILMPKGSGMNSLLQSLDLFTEDFMIERVPDRLQERESL
ncbi:MAG: AbrB/MazE/SpoVT family DNA-binding domain-containing protein [Lachnospiraceae bacterium]|nr:AbrB/MazE/SpoVT family DNA-binding domain-containing protein [Lachnospiraceae bacterium]MBQ3906252.1 AbrB/MazE/SpoVT family DNA-binding domain-containing protein [Lachnospiraceae bacterium]